ncbi:hypothetical protein HK102_009869 [Quaeritorhiza haematococci]|nr:hypothetical protein HK102_009869 [Quaeritorhiza haematococci]
MVSTANKITDTGFEIAKLSTHLGMEIAKGVVDGIGHVTKTTPVTNAVSTQVLTTAENIAVAGIEVGQFWTDFGLACANEGIATADRIACQVSRTMVEDGSGGGASAQSSGRGPYSASPAQTQSFSGSVMPAGFLLDTLRRSTTKYTTLRRIVTRSM